MQTVEDFAGMRRLVIRLLVGCLLCAAFFVAMLANRDSVSAEYHAPLGRTHVEFRAVASTDDAGASAITMKSGESHQIARSIELDETDIRSTKAGRRDIGTAFATRYTYFITLDMTPTGRERLARSTQAQLYGDIAILVDGSLVSVARVMEPITDGRFELAGSFSEAEVNSLAANLNRR